MVHFNISPPATYEKPEVHNNDCQHAFVLVGEKRVFGVHMTQFHCEKHKYQLIMHIELPPKHMKTYQKLRARFPDESFVLCNDDEDLFTIPKLGRLGRETFKCSIYQGFRPPKVDPPPADWFPWNKEDTLPAIGPFEVKVKRIVQFRPFAHNDRAPDHANYLLFGYGSEAHMHNIQNAEQITGPHDLPLYGMDYDHVMSLAERPEWISDDMLEAGVIVTVPAIRRRDTETGKTILLPKEPWSYKDNVATLYRALQPPRNVVAGYTFWWGSDLCNSPELWGGPGHSFNMSPMPEEYCI